MSYMVKNPGLMPGFSSLTNGDVNFRASTPLFPLELELTILSAFRSPPQIGRKKKMLKEIMKGCWQASFYPDVTTGRGFTPDALISNPPAFGHIHLAEMLGIPLQMSFTMPWSATKEFHRQHLRLRLAGLATRADIFPRRLSPSRPPRLYQQLERSQGPHQFSLVRTRRHDAVAGTLRHHQQL